MARLSETSQGIDWVMQFRPEHQVLACGLLDSISLIAHDELVHAIRGIVNEIARTTNGPIALFAEREVKRGKGRSPHAIYKQPRRKKKRRAYGAGPQPVEPKYNLDLTVGSEGIIAWLVSDICKQDPTRFVSHPSPDQIRKRRVRRFVIVTDMIGSGQRVREYLDAMWKVASVRSWKSFGFVDFTIAAFSGTEKGISYTRKHRANPDVLVAKSCPTISSEFNRDIAKLLRSICVHYDPVDHDPIESLGHRGSEVLLVFSHGCPNNAPRILFKEDKRHGWKPLFPGRSATPIEHAFSWIDKESDLRRKLTMMKETRLAEGNWMTRYSDDARDMLLLLAALRRGPRQPEALSRRTGLSIPTIGIFIESAIEWKWLDSNWLLTKDGKGQLDYARRVKKEVNAVDDERKEFYFPKLLRAPVDASSSR